jgi:hypothetical protein
MFPKEGMEIIIDKIEKRQRRYFKKLRLLKKRLKKKPGKLFLRQPQPTSNRLLIKTFFKKTP